MKSIKYLYLLYLCELFIGLLTQGDPSAPTHGLDNPLSTPEPELHDVKNNTKKIIEIDLIKLIKNIDEIINVKNIQNYNIIYIFM